MELFIKVLRCALGGQDLDILVPGIHSSRLLISLRALDAQILLLKVEFVGLVLAARQTFLRVEFLSVVGVVDVHWALRVYFAEVNLD